MSQDLIYYNIQMTCKKNRPTDPDVKAIFQEGRTEALVKDAQKYHFTISRFTINSNNIPILIPKIQAGQSNINLTSYGMMMAFNDGTDNETTDAYYLTYDCRNKYFNNSVNPPTIQQDDNPYYYLLNIQHFVDMFNACLSDCYNDMKDKVSSLSQNPPQLIYNNNNTFSLYFNSTDFAKTNNFNI